MWTLWKYPSQHLEVRLRGKSVEEDKMSILASEEVTHCPSHSSVIKDFAWFKFQVAPKWIWPDVRLTKATMGIEPTRLITLSMAVIHSWLFSPWKMNVLCDWQRIPFHPRSNHPLKISNNSFWVFQAPFFRHTLKNIHMDIFSMVNWSTPNRKVFIQTELKKGCGPYTWSGSFPIQTSIESEFLMYFPMCFPCSNGHNCRTTQIAQDMNRAIMALVVWIDIRMWLDQT